MSTKTNRLTLYMSRKVEGVETGGEGKGGTRVLHTQYPTHSHE